MTRELLIFLIIAGVSLAIILFFFLKWLFSSVLTKRIEAQAEVINKYTIERNITGQRSDSFLFYIIFKVDNSEYKFKMSKEEYMKINLNDTGTLSYKGDRFLSFK